MYILSHQSSKDFWKHSLSSRGQQGRKQAQDNNKMNPKFKAAPSLTAPAITRASGSSSTSSILSGPRWARLLLPTPFALAHPAYPSWPTPGALRPYSLPSSFLGDPRRLELYCVPVCLSLKPQPLRSSLFSSALGHHQNYSPSDSLTVHKSPQFP